MVPFKILNFQKYTYTNYVNLLRSYKHIPQFLDDELGEVLVLYSGRYDIQYQGTSVQMGIAGNNVINKDSRILRTIRLSKSRLNKHIH